MRIPKCVASAIVASGLLAQTVPVNAQATEATTVPPPTQQSALLSTPQSPSAVVLQATMQAAIFTGCGQMVLLMAPKIRTDLPFIDTTKLNESACRCTTDRFMADGRFQELLKMSDADLKTISSAPNFRQFVAARLMGIAFECIGTQVNEQTNNANLPFQSYPVLPRLPRYP